MEQGEEAGAESSRRFISFFERGGGGLEDGTGGVLKGVLGGGLELFGGRVGVGDWRNREVVFIE